MTKTAIDHRTDPAVDLDVDLDREIDCECMLCDLPNGVHHGPVQWRVHLYFPGPYPTPGDEVMLLCGHCRDRWVDGDWPPPFNNFYVVSCVGV